MTTTYLIGAAVLVLIVGGTLAAIIHALSEDARIQRRLDQVTGRGK